MSNRELKKNILESIRGLNLSKFKQHFQSYKYVLSWYQIVPIGGELVKDVYRDGFILVKMIKDNFDLDEVDRNLCNFIYKVSEEDYVGVDTLLNKMKYSKVLLFQINLFKIVFIFVLAELNVITQDEKYKNYLPKKLVENGGSMKICKQYIGCSNDFVKREHIKHCAAKSRNTAMECENCLCK